MPENIVINGKAVATDHQHQHDDASSSNHILIRTSGEPLNKAQKQELKTLGVHIHEFVGNESQQLYLCGYQKESLVKIRDLDFVEYADVYADAFCVPGDVQAACEQADGAVEVDVLMHQDIEDIDQELVAKISELTEVSQDAISVDSSMVRMKVDAQALDRLAALDEVRVIHPVKKRTLFTNVARKLLDSDDEKFKNGTVYKGQGQKVCVADTGFDKGGTTDVHDAFTGRVDRLFSWGRKRQNITDDPDGHGTHVCGSVLAKGQHDSEGPIDGTAPAATLVVQSMFAGFDGDGESMLGGYPGDLGRLFDQGYQAGARVHTNSWGTPLPRSNRQNPYDSGAASIDKYIWEHQDMTVLFAAGNDGQDSNLDGKVNDRSLGAEAAAKNCITVGASENLRPTLKSGDTGRPYTYGGFWPRSFPRNPLKDDHQANNPEGLAAFSSRGPSLENRLKPDVVAPGTAILSTKSRKMANASNVSGVSSDGRYLYMSGTSMATPLVAGCCAAIRECLVKNGYKDETNGVTNPTASLIKALVINGAVTVAGQYMPVHISKEPNPHSGFGRVNLANSIEMVESQIKTSGYGIGAIEEETEEPFELEIPIPSGGNTQTLKVTLAYADLPGAALSNDLNLVVVAGGKERHGNQGSQEFDVGARESFDRSNNVEQVVWHQVAGDKVKVVIKHYRLVSPRVPFATTIVSSIDCGIYLSILFSITKGLQHTLSSYVSNNSRSRSKPEPSDILDASTMTDFDTDVLIIGAGVTGLSLAALLSGLGVKTVAIAKHNGTAPAPRAHITNQRTMEIFRGMGIEKEVKAVSTPLKDLGSGVMTTSLTGTEVGRYRCYGAGDHQLSDFTVSSPCEMQNSPQHLLEPVLLIKARESGAQVRFNHELIGIDQSDHVAARVRERVTGSEYTIRARYAVGADGARSVVASLLDFPFEGKPGLMSMLTSWLEVDLTPYTSWRPACIYWLLQPGNENWVSAGNCLCVKPFTEWTLTRQYDPADGEPDTSEEATIEYARWAMGLKDVSIPMRVKHVGKWQVNHMVSKEYRRGRTFLAGDAAHRHPPASGLGTNTSIQDSFNLAWKLALVIKGHAGDGLLDSYDHERQPVGKQVVDHAITTLYEQTQMSHVLGFNKGISSEQGFASLDDLFSDSIEAEERRRKLTEQVGLGNRRSNAIGLHMGHRYKTSSAVVGDGTPFPPHVRDPVLYYEPTTHPGAYLPHAWVQFDKKLISTLDVVQYGHFSLIVGIGRKPWELAATQISQELGIQLRVYSIGARCTYDDVYGEWKSRQEISDQGALLVRPDRHIAWRSANRPDDPTAALKSAILHILDRSKA
ncbi:hypothetical protein F66182_6994 [Fusarium sp. NRRL 66182]|nr:hypothetical protein F66182_6994 [Fusarium sp. NRRL 66182]